MHCILSIKHKHTHTYRYIDIYTQKQSSACVSVFLCLLLCTPNISNTSAGGWEKTCSDDGYVREVPQKDRETCMCVCVSAVQSNTAFSNLSPVPTQLCLFACLNSPDAHTNIRAKRDRVIFCHHGTLSKYDTSFTLCCWTEITVITVCIYVIFVEPFFSSTLGNVEINNKKGKHPKQLLYVTFWCKVRDLPHCEWTIWRQPKTLVAGENRWK